MGVHDYCRQGVAGQRPTDGVRIIPQDDGGTAFRKRTTLRHVKQELIKAETRLSLNRLTGPVSGDVQQLAISTIGSVASPGMQMMVIVPEGSALEIEA